MLDDPNRPDWKKGFFVGMPAPMGASCVLLPLYAVLAGIPAPPGLSWLVLGYTLAIAFLTISTIPMISSKRIVQKINRSYVLPLFVLLVLFVGLIVSYPFETMAVLILFYLASIPFGVLRYRALDAEWLASQAKPAEPSATTPAAP
jgi:CDP-diacylglycerol--serine O-phosphatidyltransferase